MAKVSLRIMRGNEPAAGAKILIGENLKEFTTNSQGRIIRDVPDDWGPIAVQIIVEGDNFSFGGGPFKIERDKELVIEV